MKFGHSKLIFYSKKHPNLSKLFFMKGNQFRTNFFFTFFVTKMTSNFWQQCAIAALEISKKHFAKFDYFVKMKPVSTMKHTNDTK